MASSLSCAFPVLPSSSDCYRSGNILFSKNSREAFTPVELQVRALSTCEHEDSKQKCKLTRRENFVGFVISTAISGILTKDKAEAASTSRRALRGEKVPESEYKILPTGLKYYDLKVGGGAVASKGSRVAVHYVVKWKGVTFMTSRQGVGVTGGTPYGFDVGASDIGMVLKGLDYGVEGMRVGGQRLLIVPPELAYGQKGLQEIPPNATLEMDVELLSIKQTPFGSPVKIVEG